MLVLSVILPIFGAISLIGYFLCNNTERVVEDLANQLIDEVDNRVHQYLETYLTTPHIINRSNANAVALGQLNIRNLKEVERFLFWQILNYEYVPDIMFANEKGDFRIADYVEGQHTIWAINHPDINKIVQHGINNSGQRTDLRQVSIMPNWDIRQRPWYKTAKRTQKATWSPIYTLGDNTDLTLNASLPIYEQKTNRLLGVFGVNLHLSRINQFLQQLKIGQSGIVFLIERDGLLIASSTQEHPYHITNNNEFKRLPATRSNHPLIKNASHALKSSFNNFYQIKNDRHLKFTQSNKQYFLHVRPFQDQYGLNWLVVTVIPESDFSHHIDSYTRRIIELSGIILLGATVFGTLATWWHTRSLLRLTSAIKNPGKGNFEQVKTIDDIREVKELTESFNQMIKELQQSYQEMRSLNEQLVAKEAYLANLLEILPVGVALHGRDGSVTYHNRIAKNLLKIDTLPPATAEKFVEVYPIYCVGTNQPYPIEQLPALRALRGEMVMLETLELHCHEKVIILGVNATPIYNQQGEIIAAVVAFQDITLRQQAEQLLSDYNQQLAQQIQQRTLALEKEIQERQKTEAALRESQTRFERLAAVAPGLIYSHLHRKDGFIGFEYVSPKIETLYEIGLDYWLENSSIDIILGQMHPDDRSGYLKASAHSGETLEQFFYEWRTISPSGKVRWLQAHSQPERRENGDICWHGFVLDVSESKQIEEALRESEARFREAFTTAAVGMAIVANDKNTILEVNGALCQMLGYLEAELVNLTVKDVTYPDDLESDLALADQLIEGKIPHYYLEKRYIHRDGHLIWGLLSVALIRDTQQHPLYFVAQVQNITPQKEAEVALQQANHKLEYLIRIDALTQVANRLYFDEYLEQEWRRGIREQEPLALILFDIDYFKFYNDYYGHPKGDRCLTAVAQVAKQALKRPADLLARYGGEEFAVILPNTPLEGAITIARNIQQSLHQLSLPHKGSLMSNHVTVSLGIACTIPTLSKTWNQLISDADRALYQAKDTGRDRYVIFERTGYRK